MKKSYVVNVVFTTPPLGQRPNASDLYITANTADLTALLQALDASPAVARLRVASTITIPDLHRISKLTHADLGIAEDTLKKFENGK